MYLVLVKNKNLQAFNDLMPEIRKSFPTDGFSIHGSEEKGYDFHIDGSGDERQPRKFAESFLKKWRPALI